MRRTLSILGLVALCGLVLLGGLGCSNPVSGKGDGSLSLMLGDQVSRTLLPSIDMKVARYRVLGVGPGGANFAAETTGVSAQFSKLAFGVWTVTVEAFNADGAAVGTGQGTVTIHSNETALLMITVKPYEGMGTLNLNLGWNAADVEMPSVSASLLPSSGSARVLDMTIAGATATFSASDIAAGYYTLTLKLLDKGVAVYGAVEVVRIVKDGATSGSFTFSNVNKPGGGLTVNIIQEMADPLTVDISGAAPAKAANKTLSLGAAVAESAVNATFVWYVNGDAQATGSSFVLGKNYVEGSFLRVDVTAFSADGKRAGSAHCELEVIAASSVFDVSGTVRQNGLGLAGVTVGAAGSGHSAITDGDGRYTIVGLSPGDYQISTDKAGIAIFPDSYTRAISVLDADLSGIDFTVVTGNFTAISAIQGRTHSSSYNNQAVSGVLGVVTLVDAKQFYMQSPDPDQDVDTSEGILIFQNAATTVQVGDVVSVNGTVSEYFPSGVSSGNLSVTEIKTPLITTIARGRALPAPVVIGRGGRIPPTAVICDDAVGTVDNSSFDPANDGIDFYESMEFMRVSINQPRAVGPTIYYGGSSNYRETALIADNGADATGLTARGGIAISANDFNPEIVFVNDKFKPFATEARTGDSFAGTITGVLDYTFSVFKIYASESLPELVRSGNAKETTSLVGDSTRLTVAGYNSENLSVASPAGDIDKCAATIVNSLGSPDILVLCEVQDNNGPVAGGTDASTSWNAIIAAVQTLGGPAYQYRDILPENNKDGGATNGNIRQGFLFNPTRVQFVDRAGGSATLATTVTNDSGSALISASPGRVDPNNSAFVSSRKPLIGEFMFQGKKLYVIGNHFNSKGGDTPLWGKTQPANLVSEVQRNQQATILSSFISQILAIEANANIVLAGDFNDFEFSNPLNILLGSNLVDLVNSTPKTDRYTYVYSGNSQVLDHIIVSPALAAQAPDFDIVHINSEYPDSERSSDHDPLMTRITLY